MAFLEQINNIIWGAPTILLILGTGIFLSLRTGFAQITLFPAAMRDFIKKCKPNTEGSRGKSSYRALCTALAATVGTGNIAGVAGAITIGGPGAVFWMWVSAFLGMVTKFAEATLAVRYRVKIKDELVGGPMYMIQNGLPKRWYFLGTTYCVFGVIAALGVGNATQVNSVIGGIQCGVAAIGYSLDGYWCWIIGLALSLLVGLVLFGGATRIGAFAESIVPFASFFYIVMALVVICICRENLPYAISSIFSGAFTPNAVTGGAVCSLFVTLRTGAARGVFTNEAGMGTASIAHAGADVDHPCQQGLMGIMEVFIDTIVICTLTALVILSSGIEIPYGMEFGPMVTIEAFQSVCGSWISIPLAVCLCAFALATIFGWGLYGLRCAQFLFGDRILRPFCFLQCVTVVFGAVVGTGVVWLLAEMINGLMALPNLIALFVLTPALTKLTMEYKTRKENPTM